jgi:adenosine deaminase
MLNHSKGSDFTDQFSKLNIMAKQASDPIKDISLNTFEHELLRDLLKALPKIELHMHLEGAISPESLIQIAETHEIALPANTVEGLRPFVQVNSDDVTLIDFLEKFKVIGTIFKTPQIVEDITYNCLMETAADGVLYTELRFSPFYMARAHGLDPSVVTEAVLRGMDRASKESGMLTEGIVIVERQEPVSEAQAVAELATQFCGRGVVALDLANDEFNYPPAPFAAVFQNAKAAGLKITVHAGEAAGPENIRIAIEDLHADRIGHGVRLLQDEAVLKLVLERNIPLELCFTSNIQTGAIENASTYPLKQLLALGVTVTVNTDDPAISGISLTDDFLKLTKHLDLTLREVAQLLQNSVATSFASEKVKLEMQTKIDKGIGQMAAALRENLT